MSDKENLSLLSQLLKSAKHGFLYGFKIRLAHSVVNSFIFSKGDLYSNLKFIVRSTMSHSGGLASLVVGYKLLRHWLRAMGIDEEVITIVAAGVIGCLVFGRDSRINEQVDLYLLSRVVLGLANLVQKWRHSGLSGSPILGPTLPQRNNSSTSLFPEPALVPLVSLSRAYMRPLAAFVWAVSLWLFEHHRDCLHGSLKTSMTYIFEDSDL